MFTFSESQNRPSFFLDIMSAKITAPLLKAYIYVDIYALNLFIEHSGEH